MLTMFDGRTKLAAQVADEVRQHFPTGNASDGDLRRSGSQKHQATAKPC